MFGPSFPVLSDRSQPGLHFQSSQSEEMGLIQQDEIEQECMYMKQLRIWHPEMSRFGMRISLS